MPPYLGERVLVELGESCAAVISDPYANRLYWLICAGSAERWAFPEIAHIQVLGTASWVVVPPGDRTCPVWLHWARPVIDGRVLTDTASLHAALTSVVADALGPREAVVRP